MSDSRLRELEHRYQLSGLVEDEAAWLAERLRVGDIKEERLRIASYCEYPAASEFFEGRSHPVAYGRWTMGIPSLGISKSLTIRVGIHIAFYVLPIFERDFPEENLPRKSIVAAIEYLLGFYSDYASNMHAISNDNLVPNRQQVVSRVITAGICATETAKMTEQVPPKAYRTLNSIAKRADWATRRPLDIKRNLSKELIPWALGYNDPLTNLLAKLKQSEAE